MQPTRIWRSDEAGGTITRCDLLSQRFFLAYEKATNFKVKRLVDTFSFFAKIYVACILIVVSMILVSMQ